MFNRERPPLYAWYAVSDQGNLATNLHRYLCRAIRIRKTTEGAEERFGEPLALIPERPWASRPSLLALPIPRPHGKFGRPWGDAIEASTPLAVGALVDWLLHQSGWTVEDPAELKKVLAEAVNHDGPTLVDVISQPLHEAAAPVSEWVA